jgi:hypothetical protein
MKKFTKFKTLQNQDKSSYRIPFYNATNSRHLNLNQLLKEHFTTPEPPILINQSINDKTQQNENK